MNKNYVIWGAALVALGVAVGAFGAHGLKDFLLANGNSDTFETAVKYQFYHAIGLMLIGIASQNLNKKWSKIAANSMLAGTLIFSGALYSICITGIKTFGAVAPIGGLLLIFAWISLALAAKTN